MKSPEKSRFGKLVAYLLDPQDKKTRVGEVAITNCVSSDTTWAVREIAATQQLNTRAISDRTYHLLVSLRAGENPDAQTLPCDRGAFCKELGYAEHQRVSVVHHDTDNVHIHVAINKIHPRTLTLHDPIRDYITLKLCAILEHELGLAQDNHERGQTRGNDVTPKSGQESFQLWLQRHAQGFIDATSWEEFHGICDAHGVRIELRANGFVFTHRRSLVRVKASSIDRRLAKTALEARLGTFIPAEYQQGRDEQEGYEKRPRFGRVDTSRLWEEYQAQRELHKTLRQAKLVSLAASRALQIDGVKAAARAKRSVIKMTLKGAGRRIAYVAVQN